MSEETTERLPIMVRWLLASKDNLIFAAFMVLGSYLFLLVSSTISVTSLVLLLHVHKSWILIAPYLSAAIMAFVLAFYFFHPTLSSEERRLIIQNNGLLWFVFLLHTQLTLMSVSRRLIHKPWYLEIAMQLGLLVGLWVFGIILPFILGRFLARRRPTPNS
jgi:hypothetical protein